MLPIWIRAAIAASLLSSTSAIAQTAMQAPYPIDHPARAAGSQIDLRPLLDGPAGQHGFLEVRDGHFTFADGQRFRCWGVNITGWASGSAMLPPKAEAEIYAESLARLGVNCVRLHFLDMQETSRTLDGEGNSGYRVPVTQTPSGLVEADRDDTRAFDPEQLDRLHYFAAQLKQRGIYLDFNLNVGRTYKPGDGVPDHDLIGVAKGITYFGPELIARQKEYARMLLTARNPYTGLRYVDDPAVAIVEIVNENSPLEFWQRNWLRGERVPGGENLQLDLTPHYAALLTGRYNAWLASNRSEEQLAQLRQQAGIGAGESIPFMRRGEFRDAPDERYRAELAFLTDLEIGFQSEMAGFLRGELGVRSVIIPTADHTYFIAGQPMMRSSAKFDVMDAHVYWQHPAIYGRRNEPMIDTPELSIPVKLARTAMSGKAFTVSEVNHPFPCDYGAEMIPVLASYAALQDWDGTFFYTFEPKLLDQATTVIGDHFDITQDPVKIAQMPVGSMIFLRGDVAAARQRVERALSTEQIDRSARMSRSEQPYFHPGFPMTLPLVHGSRVACLDCDAVAPPALQVSNPITSDTGELAWSHGEPRSGFLTIDTPRTQGLVGFVPRKDWPLTHLSAELGNEFAAVTLSSLDGEPIYRSDRLLLTTAGRSGNSGMEWNERRTMLTKWGKAPSWIEPITGWVILKDLDGALGVWVTPLDGGGQPLGPEVSGRMLEAGWEVPVGTPAATTYLVRVAR